MVDDDECEVPLELAEREAHRLDEVALVVALDEVRDGLRVGLGGERMAVRGEALLELAVVLDDAVQDDREPRLITAGERMGVLLRDAPVRRPARVPEARRRGRSVRPGSGPQVAERPHGAHVVEAAALEEGDSRRVVAAVLQALEALEQQRLALTRSDVSDDPAHVASFAS
jgi:hypothetical protein